MFGLSLVRRLLVAALLSSFALALALWASHP